MSLINNSEIKAVLANGLIFFCMNSTAHILSLEEAVLCVLKPVTKTACLTLGAGVEVGSKEVCRGNRKSRQVTAAYIVHPV